VEVSLPEGYRLEYDPEVLLLVAGDDVVVGVFSARGATERTIEQAAWEAYESPVCRRVAAD
jgi:hypothetical protein